MVGFISHYNNVVIILTTECRNNGVNGSLLSDLVPLRNDFVDTLIL